MKKDILITLDSLYSLPPLERYETILKIASQVQSFLMEKRDSVNVELGKKVMDKINGVRYLMASNKATDIGDFDIKLKQAWDSINILIEN